MEIVSALFKLGIPLAVISWLIFSWLYREDLLDINADRKSTSAGLKQIKESHKQEKGERQHYLYGKWMWFGSGFYGLAALWTFIVVEIMDVFNFVFSFPGFEALFGGGIINFLIGALLNQIGNIGSAFTWFHYWPDDSVLVSIFMAYGGYLVGITAAKKTHKDRIKSSQDI